MQDEAFREWLKAKGHHHTSTPVSDARRLDKKRGGLDREFEKDRLEGLIKSLTYTSEDVRNKRPDDSGLGFKPKVPMSHEYYYERIRGSFTNYRRITKLYVEFRDSKGAIRVLLPKQGDAVEFDPTDKEDGRKRTIQSIITRRGQQKFRDEACRVYGNACAISGCAILDVLEAAHIAPYLGKQTNHITNSILLRADLHTLFDCGLITIHPATLSVVVSPALRGSEYAVFDGKPLRATTSKAAAPNSEALAIHMAEVYGKYASRPTPPARVQA